MSIYCTRCHEPNDQKICIKCTHEWANMRLEAFKAIEAKHGEISQANLGFCQKEIRRLEKIWRKDKDQFAKEIESYYFCE